MNNLKKILRNIEDLTDLAPEEVNKGRDIGDKIIEYSEDLRKMVLEERDRKKFDYILSKIKSIHSKLSKDVLNAEKTELSSDWREFARKDLSVFKDEVLLLQEFLISHKEKIRKNRAKFECGIDLWDLADSLKRENYVDELTLSNFLRQLREMDESETERKSEEFEEDLKRISRCLSALKEVEAKIPNAG